jgi:hypothetical protein
MAVGFKIIILSLLSSLIIGVVHSLFFLTIEEPLKEKLQEFNFFKDEIVASLFSNSISVSLAVCFGFFITSEIEKSYKLIENSFFHSIGIFVSNFIIILIYKLGKNKK